MRLALLLGSGAATQARPRLGTPPYLHTQFPPEAFYRQKTSIHRMSIQMSRWLGCTKEDTGLDEKLSLAQLALHLGNDE